MKRILFVLIPLLVLCGCRESFADTLQKMGYSEEEIAKIETLNEEQQSLFADSYNETALSYLMMEGSLEENLDTYLEYDGKMEKELIVRLVNEKIISKDNAEKIISLYTDEAFIERNESLYLKYLSEYDDTRKLLEIVNTKRYEELFSDIEPVDMSKGDLVLVNKYYRLAEDYEPDDLVYVDAEYGRGRLREKVYEAFKALYEDALKEGHHLFILSSYRSYDYQDGLYNRYLQSDSRENVDTYSARPGHSEHQTGMAIDVSIPGYSLMEFGDTDAAKWLAQHCMEYGFIVRYPKDKTDITGYIEEPWHIRYLGIETAMDVYAKNMTYDEYYACYIL